MNEIWKQLYNAAKQKLNPRVISPFVESGGVAAALLTEKGNIYKEYKYIFWIIKKLDFPKSNSTSCKNWPLCIPINPHFAKKMKADSTCSTKYAEVTK